MMTGELEPGYLLHRRDYRETSFIVEFLTRSGYQRLISRGARRGKNAIAGILQPFLPLTIAWRGTSELPSLTVCEPSGNQLGLSGELMYCGFYVNEITSRMAYRHEIGAGLFPVYEATLTRLAAASDVERTLRVYEKRLLEAAGIGLLLEHSKIGAPLEPDGEYAYSLESGPALGPGNGTEFRVSGRTLIALQREEFGETATRREAKWLMREVLRSHLGAKPLASRALFTTTP